jgi:adenylosuccinate synthase
MRYTAVIGLGYGDEGKGVMTDYLCSQIPRSTIVVRFSGGHQAGHTVEHEDGYRHVFANFGSGTLRGIPTYWSSNCTFEPTGAINELKLLRDNDFNPMLYVDADAPLTTPYDIEANRVEEKERRHGSCGVGFGTTIQREKNLYHFRFKDIFFEDVFREKLKLVEHYYGDRAMGVNPKQFIKACNKMIENRNIKLVWKIPAYDNYIYEGSQGLMLDQNIGFYPHVTWANTGTKALPRKKHFDMVLVTRAYQTRHGEGPMTNTSHSHLYDDPLETNVHNHYQGKFRRGILDVNMLVYAIKSDTRLRSGKDRKFLAITCLDHIKEYKLLWNKQIRSFNTQKNFINFIEHCLDGQEISFAKVLPVKREEKGKPIVVD